MSRGRIAKPTALKALAGNAGHRRDDRGDEPAPPAGAPEPPDFVTDRARRKWFEICAQMIHVPGWLTKLDGDTLAVYCLAWDRMAVAEIEIPSLQKKLRRERKAKARGQLLNEINTLIGQRKSAIKDMKSSGDALGMSPAARTRIRVNPGQGELPLGSEDDSPFAKSMSLARGA